MERPTGVTIIAVLYFLGAACLGLAGLGFLVGGSAVAAALAKSGGAGGGLFAAGGAIIGGFFLVCAIVDLALGVGFVKLQNWARVIAIVFTGIAMLFGLFGLMGVMLHFALFRVVFQLLVLGLEVWIVTYLFKPEVKQAFGATGF